MQAEHRQGQKATNHQSQPLIAISGPNLNSVTAAIAVVGDRQEAAGGFCATVARGVPRVALWREASTLHGQALTISSRIQTVSPASSTSPGASAGPEIAVWLGAAGRAMLQLQGLKAYTLQVP